MCIYKKTLEDDRTFGRWKMIQHDTKMTEDDRKWKSMLYSIIEDVCYRMIEGHERK